MTAGTGRPHRGARHQGPGTTRRDAHRDPALLTGPQLERGVRRMWRRPRIAGAGDHRAVEGPPVGHHLTMRRAGRHRRGETAPIRPLRTPSQATTRGPGDRHPCACPRPRNRPLYVVRRPRLAPAPPPAVDGHGGVRVRGGAAERGGGGDRCAVAGRVVAVRLGAAVGLAGAGQPARPVVAVGPCPTCPPAPCAGRRGPGWPPG